MENIKYSILSTFYNILNSLLFSIKIQIGYELRNDDLQYYERLLLFVFDLIRKYQVSLKYSLMSTNKNCEYCLLYFVYHILFGINI